jgi:hypothetical protein
MAQNAYLKDEAGSGIPTARHDFLLSRAHLALSPHLEAVEG